jgi:hypothetical protein
MSRCAAAGLIGLIAFTALPSAEPAAPAVVFEPVLHRFLARADEPLLAYRGSRHIEARNDRLNLSGWMEVATELGEDGFHYQVIREGGSDMIRHKVFRSMLDNEVELFASGEAERAGFNSINYDLSPAVPDEPGLVKLLAHPKRKDVTLIDGAVYVTDTDADLVRAEGRLSKNPSFWTKHVDVVKHYARVGGLRVPVRVDSTAQMRLAGTAVLTMTYEYEMINGVPVPPQHELARR